MGFAHKPKDWIKKAATSSRILQLAGYFAPPGAIILMYHSVRDAPDREANTLGRGIIHATDVFARQMELIARRFRPVSLNDLLSFLHGDSRLPARAVVVTFDDGYADNLGVAAPILDRYGIQAAFYLTVSLIGTRRVPWFCRLRHAFATTRMHEWKEAEGGTFWKLADHAGRTAAFLRACDLCAALSDEACQKAIAAIERDLDVHPLEPSHPLMLNWDQVRALRRAGHIVGSHTLSHPNVAHVGREEAQRELMGSKQRMQAELGSEVSHFSYPHPALDPEWTPETLEITRRTGYQTCVTTARGTVRFGANPLCLARVRTPREEHNFVWTLECAFLGYNR